ncbi:MAG TPA: S1/P1 nuclease [Puia sp.]|nr:S1/P1 nuclease [Puia sp.]
MKTKKTLLSIIFFSISILLISWGVTGHRTVGKIAENHLTANARNAVHELLGAETLADVSTWADEVRNEPEYKATGSWHYINLPLGLSYADFQRQVEGMSEANVYSALLQQEKILMDKSTTREQKIEALKFIVHFVGDLHQPMHVSRAEDKGGNTVQLNYNGQGTNLHSVWDTKLIERESADYQQLAEKYGQASPAQIKQWQSDPVIKWIWESYTISSQLYAEVDAMKSRSIDDNYYTAHTGIVHERLEQAGVRLAGVLNTMFKNGVTASAASVSGSGTTSGGGKPAARAEQPSNAKTVELKDAANHIDEYAKVCGQVYGYKALDGLTLVNMGASYPDQLMTLVLKGPAKEAASSIDGKTICVAGKIILYKGKPEIIITDPALLTK